MASVEANRLAETFASVRERITKPNADLATVRDICECLHSAASEPEGVNYIETDADGVPALWCIPAGSDPDRVLLHSHAGGTVVFSHHSDRKAAGHIAKAVGVRALVLDYRKSPEYKFPAQIDDVEKAYYWLVSQGIRGQNIVSMGHSIGGNFAVRLALNLREKRRPLPGAILSISPWFDPTLTNPMLESNATTDKLISKSMFEYFRELWIGGTGVATDDPRINMLYADLTELPPSMVYYGEHEIFAGDAMAFAKRARPAGIDVTLHSLRAGQHSFILGAGRVPEVDVAIAEMADWLRRKLGLSRAA